MTEDDSLTVETTVSDEDAARDIAKAVSMRHALARRYVRRLRRRHPDATPADVVQMLERHYAGAISTAGAVLAAGAFAAEVGVSLIPGGGAAAAGAKRAGAQAAKGATKAAAKKAAKATAANAAKGLAARQVTALIPAGDRQLQFEITAIFGLALADVHGMDLDRDQAHALVYGLANGQVSQQQIASMASDLAQATAGDATGLGQRIAAGRRDWSHWATTLADTLPSGAAQTLVRTMQTGQLETVREGLTDRQQVTIEYGVGALTGGMTRFLFGRHVVEASRAAFPEAPETFPPHLAVIVKGDADDSAEPNRALAALEKAATTTRSRVAAAATTVGSGVTTGAVTVTSGVAGAAGAATRPFRRVDLDGDGVPDEPQALTAAKGAGGAIADAVGSTVGRAFRTRRRTRADADSGADPTAEPSAE